MSESISPVWLCCAGNCFQDVEVSVRALLMRIVGLNLSLCIFQFLVKMIAQNNTFRPEPAANRAGKERREKSETRRHVELCVDPCKLSGWRDTHVSHVSLCFFFFSFGYIFLLPSSHGHSSLFSFYLSIGLLFSSLTSLSVSLKHMFASIASPSPFSSPCSGISGI